MLLRFSKYQGTGNDFILVDNREGHISLTQEQIRLLCDRHFGIGADGLMLLEQALKVDTMDELTAAYLVSKKENVDFKMVYYNSDGNQSSMCGNGGRCIVAFARRLGLVQNEARFVAVDGLHEAKIDGDMVSLKMNDVRHVETGDGYFYLNTGSPHYVTFASDVQHIDMNAEGRKIRYSERFAEEGTNVNFVEKQDDALFVRTYERGVENETLSCGTGVTASALVASMKGLSTGRNNCLVRTPGGSLNVKFDKVLENNFYNIWLEGPAVFVFEGQVDPGTYQAL